VNANLFALLDDDDDDNAAAPAQKQAPAKKSQPKSEDQVSKPNKERKQGKGDNRRGKGGERDDSAYDGSDKPTKPGDGEGRKGGRKGGRRDDNGKGKGKGNREFDRRSGTGRGKGEAREGRGKYNWGDKTDYKPTEGAEPAAEGAEAPAAEPEPEPVVEEEDNTMSLDEYMAAQKAKANSGLPQLKGERKVEKMDGKAFTREGNGSEDEAFGMIFKDYDGKHGKHDAKEKREGWVAADNVLNLRFADHSSDDRPSKGKGKGDRGDRGGKGKGDGGRGPKKQSRPSGPGFSGGLDDNSAFPGLGN
jgi:plasminogen activator inhibitor 1 RNA-binding protein